MSTIVTRAGKGSALTHNEVDANFVNLNTDKLEAATTSTLTNKTINLTSNTLTGTTAQFNTALSDGDFATLAGTETLTNKTITSPTITGGALNGTLGATTPSTVAATTGTFSSTVTSTTAQGFTVTPTTGTDGAYVKYITTGGTYFVGSNNSAGGTFGTTPYALTLYAPIGRTIETYINSTGIVTTVSPTGLSVTGNLTASSLTSGRVTYASTGGLLADSANFTFNGTGVVVGAGSANNFLNINGASSGTNGGASLNVLNGGTTRIALGNYSNLLGGAYDATATIYANGALRFWNGATNMTLDSSGNLGLGTTPSAWSSVFKAVQIGVASNAFLAGRTDSGAKSNVQLGVNAYFNGTNWIYSDTSFASRYYQNNGLHIWDTAPSGTAGNAITFTQAMTLDASGNVGIGVTPSAWSSVYKTIQLGGTSANYITSNSGVFGFTNNVYIDAVGAKYITTGSAASRHYQLNGAFVWENAPSGTADAAVTLTTRMTLDASGNLTISGATATKASGTTWANPSDIRLKDNITDYSKGLAELMQVNVKEWTYNGKGGTTDGMKGLGVIADEIMTVLPDTVDNYQTKLNTDDEADTDIKKFDATEITWLMLNSIKEQQAMIDELKAKVAALEAA
jgi:hypothetical protein